ncbi:MAG: hypothetical protein ABI199_01615 [Bacteroidia bacterium]
MLQLRAYEGNYRGNIEINNQKIQYRAIITPDNIIHISDYYPAPPSEPTNTTTPATGN